MPLIKKENITNETIVKTLKAAGINSEINEDYDLVVVHAPDGGISFGAWVKIVNQSSILNFRTSLQCKEDIPVSKLQALVGSMNDDYSLVKFTFTIDEHGRADVNGTYDLCIDFGIIDKQLIVSLMKFTGVFIGAIREHDKEDIFFS